MGELLFYTSLSLTWQVYTERCCLEIDSQWEQVQPEDSVLYTMKEFGEGTACDLLFSTPWSHSSGSSMRIAVLHTKEIFSIRNKLRTAILHTMKSHTAGAPETCFSLHHGFTQGMYSLRTDITYTMESFRVDASWELLFWTPWCHLGQPQPEKCCSKHHEVTQARYTLRIAILYTKESLRRCTAWVLLFWSP